MTIGEALQIALEHHNAGRLREAEQLYRGILGQLPDHASALYLLGRLAAQTGRLDESIRCLSRSIELEPTHPEAQAAIGEVYERLNRPDDAIRSYRHATSRAPDATESRLRLGQLLLNTGMLDEAIACYEHVLSRRPDYELMMRANLAEAWRRKGDLQTAERYARQAIALDPNFAGGHCNLGLILHAAGRYDEAIVEHELTLKLDDKIAQAWNNLGLSLSALKRFDESIGVYERALAVCGKEASSVLWTNMGTILAAAGRLDEAIAAHRNALQINPASAEASGNLGGTLREQGLLSEAIDCFRRSVALAPWSAPSHSNLLFALNADPSLTPRQILAAHLQWASQHADPMLRTVQPHLNIPDPTRRIRVGYVSSDFRDHPVGRFILPLLENIDRNGFTTICYNAANEHDEFTGRFRAAADRWHDVAAWTDEQLAQKVREDEVDVLVDLGLHAAGTRLMTFAQKPAPVQITFLSYAGTSGMQAMDYRITDPYLDPPGGDADEPGAIYSERSLWLPQTYWCYQAHPAAPPGVAAPPVQTAGFVTFGSFNYFGKCSEPALNAWARILLAVPRSRLLVHCLAGQHRERIVQRFVDAGVEAQRVEFFGKLPISNYFAHYGRVDVALDPFPYAGGTTSCDALWMGVPVITLRGKSAVGRAGVSILSNVGLPELIAEDVDRYVDLAANIAGDMSRLTALRASMRERMRDSKLMDTATYARGVESTFRTAWRGWCERPRLT